MSAPPAASTLRSACRHYSQRDAAIQQALAALTRFKGSLYHEFNDFTYDDGRVELLLSITGVIPVPVQANIYQCPITFWLPLDFPAKPPIVFVLPSHSLIVRPGPNVDPSGKVVHSSYMDNWSRKPEGCSLVALISDELVPMFSRRYPVMARPPTAPVPSAAQPPVLPSMPAAGPPRPPPPPPPPFQHPSSPAPRPLSGPSSVSLVGDDRRASFGSSSPAPPPPRPPTQYDIHGQGYNRPPPPHPVAHPPPPPPGYPSAYSTRMSPSPPVPPPPMRTGRVPESYASTSRSSAGMTSTFSYAPSTYASPPLPPVQTRYEPPRPMSAPMPPPTAHGPPRSSGHSAVEPTSPTNQALRTPAARFMTHQSRPSLNILDDDDDTSPSERASKVEHGAAPAPPRPPNPALLALRTQLHAKLSTSFHGLRSRVGQELEHQSMLALDLNKGEPAMRDEMQRLQVVRTVCSNVRQRYDAVVQEGEKRLKEYEMKGEGPEVDEIVCSSTVVYNQLLDLITEDAALEDTIYHLGRALNSDSAKLDLDQFLKRVRALAREQFLRRATINKIMLGLAARGGSSTARTIGSSQTTTTNAVMANHSS